MKRFLVIVESPAKAKTINKYLGRGYVVKSSFGHVRDLPTGAVPKEPGKKLPKKSKKGKKLSAAKIKAQKEKRATENLVRRMGINPDRGWAAHYEVLPGKE